MLGIKKCFSVVIVVILFMLSSILYAQESVSACGHHDYPPWNWHKDGKIVGACAEVTQTLFAKFGIDVDLSYIGPWKRCQRAIQAGKIDINICSFTNPARQAYSQFITTPMGYNDNAIFVKKGREFSFSNWDDLKGRVGIMMLGVSLGEDFDRFLAQNIKLVRVNTNRQVFGLLERERADFAPYGRYSGAALLKSRGQDKLFSILEPPAIKGELYISMSKSSQYLHVLPQIEALMQQPGYDDWVIKLLEKYSTVYANDQLNLLIREKQHDMGIH